MYIIYITTNLGITGLQIIILTKIHNNVEMRKDVLKKYFLTSREECPKDVLVAEEWCHKDVYWSKDAGLSQGRLKWVEALSGKDQDASVL